jgi:glycosyltransferase involved in cell wall biosynthesis
VPCSKRKTRILFIYSVLSSFVRRDLEMLERHFDVKEMKVETFFVFRKGRDPLVFLKLFKGVLWADVVFCWFALANAFFTVLFCIFLRKKSAIVVGGYDVIYIPEIDYGTLNSLKNCLRAKFVMEYATKILPFSNYAKYRVLSITKKANLCVIPLACDTEKFKPIRGRKENLVITVCYVNRDNIKRKGLKTFVESAKFLPNVKFALIGAHVDDAVNYLKKISSPNVEFTGYVSSEELIKWYQRAKVYCQLSYEEGFGVALIEAMACGCIPVVSSKAKALRETVGECAFYVPYGDLKITSEAIKEALSAPLDLGLKARERVRSLFSIKEREKKLSESMYDVSA